MEKRATEAELKIAKLEAQLEAATARANSEIAAARFQAEKDVAVAEERAMAAEQRANAAELMHKSNAELMAKVDSNLKVVGVNILNRSCAGSTGQRNAW